MTKVLLTGANGYVGSHLVGTILDRGFELTTLTRRPFAYNGTNNKILTNYETSDLEALVRGQDVVIHLAAMAHQPGIKHNLKNDNVDNALTLASVAKRVGVQRFIFISSIKAMGESTSEYPFHVDTPPSPEDAYGRSKLAAEQGLYTILDNTDTRLVVIRPPLVWGGVMKGNLALLQKLVSWGIPLPFGGINNKRDIVSVTNLCELICRVIDHPNAPGNTFLVSDGVARTTAQIAQLIAPKGISPRLFACPDSILGLITKMPVAGGRFAKLVGSLEVDIEPTKRLLEWSPKRC